MLDFGCKSINISIEQAAEKALMNVILSAAKNLGASDINTLRDSSSSAEGRTPQNDEVGDFFSSLLVTLR